MIQVETFQVGDSVRSFDFPGWDEVRGEALGMNTTGERVSYVEGVIVALIPAGRGYHPHPTYEISVTRIVRGGEICDVEGAGVTVCPPVNGTPTHKAPGHTFGVVAA